MIKSHASNGTMMEIMFYMLYHFSVVWVSWRIGVIEIKCKLKLVKMKMEHIILHLKSISLFRY